MVTKIKSYLKTSLHPSVHGWQYPAGKRLFRYHVQEAAKNFDLKNVFYIFFIFKYSLANLRVAYICLPGPTVNNLAAIKCQNGLLHKPNNMYYRVYPSKTN